MLIEVSFKSPIRIMIKDAHANPRHEFHPDLHQDPTQDPHQGLSCGGSSPLLDISDVFKTTKKQRLPLFRHVLDRAPRLSIRQSSDFDLAV